MRNYTEGDMGKFIRFLLVFLVAGALACADDDTPSNNDNNMLMPDAGNDTNPDMPDTDELALNAVNPKTGSLSGGTTINIAGTGFQSGMTVTVGGNAAADVVVITPTSATAVTPAGMVGAVTVTVENPDGESDSLLNAFTYVDSDDPSIGFCQLQMQDQPIQATAGEASPLIYAIVFAEGLTQGEGEGEFIEGQLGWGSGADVSGYTFSDMTYNTDKDGLAGGDLANDEYQGSLTIPADGEQRYVARFRTEQRADDWVYCDLDGSDNDIQDEQLGTISVTAPMQPEVTFCELEAQSPVDVETGTATPRLFAQVYAEGVTTGAGQGSNINVELGFGSTTDMLDDFAFTAMTYDSDVDGINAGDLANDRYGGTLTVTTAGEYRYIARARVGDSGMWTFCDLDGSNAMPSEPGVLNVNDPPEPEIGFCQTTTAMASATTGMASGDITAQVFVAGVTAGSGQGNGITAELRYGAAGTDPTTWTDSVTPSYASDVDGLNPGDLANDEYSTTLTIGTMGDYDYAYRFSLDGGTNWTWCDTDGSGASDAFEPAKVATIEVRDVMVNRPDACNLQFPELVPSLLVGDSLAVFGRVTEGTLTGNAMADASIVGELVVGPTSADPLTQPGMFTTVAATVKTMNLINIGANEDEYEASWTPSSAGTYQFLYRFSADGGTNFSYCDLNGNDSSSAFDRQNVGVVKVFAAGNTPDLIDYCHVFQGSTTASGGVSPPITVETYEMGVTDSSPTGAEIEAEIGYGDVGANPALSGAFTWNPMAYKGQGANMSNSEYEGKIYPDMRAPAAGTYDVVVRVRLSGTTEWQYCDNNNSTMDFFTAQTSTHTVP